MSGEDAALLVDQHRVGPAELDHRRRDLIDLRLAVRPWVALVGAQALDRPQLDPVGERDQSRWLRCSPSCADRSGRFSTPRGVSRSGGSSRCPRAARSRRCRPRQRRRSGPDRPAPARGRRCSGRRVRAARRGRRPSSARSAAARPGGGIGHVQVLGCGGESRRCQATPTKVVRTSGCELRRVAAARRRPVLGSVPKAEAACGVARCGATVRCELRTRNRGAVARELSRRAPRYPFRQGRTRSFKGLARGDSEQRRFRGPSRSPRSATEPSGGLLQRKQPAADVRAGCRCSP